MNWAARFVALALEPDEREAVLGDFVEHGSSGMRSVFDVLGLVVRRQLLIWTGWRPWLALVGIVGVSGFYLSGMLYRLSIEIFEQARSWQHYGVHYDIGVTSFRDDLIHMSCLAVAIFFWIAANVSLLRRLSGRATWLTGLLFYIVVCDSFVVRFILSGAVIRHGNSPWWAFIKWIVPLDPESLCFVVFLFVIPAICGATGKPRAMNLATALCTLMAAVVGASHAQVLQSYNNREFGVASWLAILAPYALVSWPILAQHWLFPIGPMNRRRPQ